MAFPSVQEFYLPDQDIIESLLGQMNKAPWKIACDPAQEVLRTYYDTFDWRLHQAGYALAGEDSSEHLLTNLYRLETGERHLHLPDSPKQFADEFPPGPLRDLLMEVAWVRRLLPVAQIRMEAIPCRILDRRGKTLVRLNLVKGEVSRPGDSAGEKFPVRLRVEGVRGYGATFRKVLVELDQHRFPEVGTDLYEEALDILSHSPGGYRPKPILQLEPQLSADKAMRMILLHLLDVMELNRPGTIDDLDSEFLHDFRVAVRRTRSALAQVKGVFPPEEIQAFRDEFKRLGSLTGPTRDLDVYLLKFPVYQGCLPEESKADLDPFLRFLRDHQRKEQKKLARALASKKVTELLAGWRRYLEETGMESPDAGRARDPVVEVAVDRIGKLYGRFVREGRAIGDTSPDEQIHQLRITGKKLRYLLEFFATLFPVKKIGKLIKATKTLQDFLGDFNDLAVQQEKLREFSEQMQAEHDTPAVTLVAMGRLVEDMAHRQREMRKGFPEHFAAFDQGRFRKLFEELFSGQKEKDS